MSNRIVVAEDERAVRESLTRALTLEGYSVTAVSDGAQALEALRAEPADVVVLDVMMPVVDGLTACRVLRSEKNRVPILMVTARTETSDRVAGLDAGADDYLPKPFALDELLARLRALLRRSRPDRVRPARAVGAQLWDRPRPIDDLRADLGLRLRPRLEEPGRVHRLPAPQDRHRRPAAADPHRARGRVHRPHEMTRAK